MRAIVKVDQRIFKVFFILYNMKHSFSLYMVITQLVRAHFDVIRRSLQLTDVWAKATYSKCFNFLKYYKPSIHINTVAVHNKTLKQLEQALTKIHNLHICKEMK